MSAYECHFCKEMFKSANILAQHQNRTKYCLALQGKENKKFTCKYCSKSLVNNERLVTHINVCKEKKNKDLEEKESSIKTNHKKEIEEILKKMEEKISNKNEQIETLKKTIEKLEAKLEKFEDAVISSKKILTESGFFRFLQDRATFCEKISI